MSTPTAQLAGLAADAYVTHDQTNERDRVVIEGIEYKVIDQANARSGYQGTLYQRVDTGDYVVAHRGTEFDRELFRDGVVADGGMVLAGVNRQEADAMAFTRRAVDLANTLNQASCQVPSITVTGHSLGGTLAQITAHRLGLPAETFNAYDAAGLASDLPRTDPDIVNHVRATDMVSAASAHVGEVRTYAAQADIDALERRGYENNARFPDVRNPIGVAVGDGFGAHYGDNFLPNGPHGRSIINPDDRARAVANADMIADYRGDVARIHNGLALPRNVIDGIGDAGARLFGRERPDPAPPSAFAPGACPMPASTPTLEPAPRDPTDARHPDHALYQQAQRGVHAIDASLGRTPDAASDRLTASVLHGAKEGGLQRIDQVVLSIATPDARAGQSVFAVQAAPGDADYRRIQLDTGTAIATRVEDSFQRIDALNAQRATAQPAIEPAQVRSGPAMH